MLKVEGKKAPAPLGDPKGRLPGEEGKREPPPTLLRVVEMGLKRPIPKGSSSPVITHTTPTNKQQVSGRPLISSHTMVPVMKGKNK